MHRLLDHGPSLPLTPSEQEKVPSLEELTGAESTRRQLLVWLGQMAAAMAIVGTVPLAGCESPNDTHRRVCRENPEFCETSEALIDLNNKSRERERGDADKDEKDEESGDSHGSLRCWKDLLHPKKWFGTHWDNLLMSTAAGLGPQMFPGDSDFENGLARVLAGTMTFFNGLTRGIVAPETVYAFFLTLWGKWSDIFGTLTEWRRGGGGGGTTTP